MEIILLEKIQNLGELGDLVNVKNGYARNYLIPQKKAVRATADAKAEVDSRRRQLAQEEGKRLEVAQARADLTVREISLTRLCSEEGGLYGSVSPVDIAEALNKAGSNIEKSEVFQPDGPIKHTGEFSAEIILHPEVRFDIKVAVHGDQSDIPAELQEDDDAHPLSNQAADNSDDEESSGQA